MSQTSKKRWKETLISILENLTPPQFKKMLNLLDKIPQGLKNMRLKVEAAQRILETYGDKESIREINEVMKKIPRNDAAIQDLLAPFVRKVKSKPQKKKQEEKRETNKRFQKQSIRAVVSRGQLPDTKCIIGKVCKKSELRTYRTQKNEEKFFFHLGVADKTASVKVMVYGNQRFATITEGTCYSFRKVLVEGNMIKVTRLSYVVKTRSVQLPPELEMEAQSLISQQAQAAQTAADTVQNVQIRITRITKSNKKYTHLEAELNQQHLNLQVTHLRLAKALGFTLGEDFGQMLQNQIPFSADVKIQGKIIKDIEKL
ncbi:uncharacterized protein LOC113142523 [Mastacembelus armatus]|uniref:uncharacterized protein LOC113142523 n=1 Tax=Mastacembelus armatus TaxID=205130 RepID=UPI000E455731|nr:uncharacterized protein LOC113142523 [Mastacembelus armatus]XP_026183333.1 uncharacterized protein LOC113142523 [Mastacembelus armatus]